MSEYFTQEDLDFVRIEKAIKFIEKNFRIQPSLQDISKNAGLSEFHFQKLFKQRVGISPKRFIQFLTKEFAKNLLIRSENILNVTYSSGLSGPGRLHDLFVQCDAVTPGEYKNKGKGLKIFYGIHHTPFGECLIANTDRGICGLYFITNENKKRILQVFSKKWVAARLEEKPTETENIVKLIFTPSYWNKEKSFHLFLQGTNFQIKVWEALLRIPEGFVVSYEDIATHIGKPKAIRAVGTAIASNPISYIIPCHRVIRKMGIFGNYQGGPARKKALLAWEWGNIDK